MRARFDKAFYEAATRGNLSLVVRYLALGVDPKYDDSRALRCAAGNGHLEIVKLLLPVSDPRADDSSALRCAAEGGHLEIVKLLLPVSNPKANRSGALRWASENGHLEVIKLLLPCSDYVVALEQPGFIYSPGCDVLLSCLPEPFIKQFMADHTDLDLPRTRATLNAQSLSSRNSTAKPAAIKSARSRC